MKTSKNVIRGALLAAGMLLAAVGASHAASTAGGVSYSNLMVESTLDEWVGPDALIVAGNPPDSPSGRIDPNLSTSPWAGVVSINIRYDGLSYICSGAMISAVHVLSAGHCVDTTGFGNVIDLNQAGNDVRVVFNNQVAVGSPNTYTLATATKVDMNPNYGGFGPCPAGVTDPEAFCLNDDLSVITLNAADVPTWATPYALTSLRDGPQTMVGFGTSGDGNNGYTVSPSFFVKRVGANISDVYDLDDEMNFTGAREVWQSDFDGNGIDSHCFYYGVCSNVLANDVETALGGGDSGGPSFQQLGDGSWAIVGNNTYSTRFTLDQIAGTFGTGSGGMIVDAYFDWLTEVTDGQVVIAAVPEPGTYALMALGLAAVGVAARRRRAA